MELRHDWAAMVFTPELFRHVFLKLIPDVIIHSEHQDEEQVRDHYDRAYIFLNFPLHLTSNAVL
jgi:sphingolipid C9-methyltransferase